MKLKWLIFLLGSISCSENISESKFQQNYKDSVIYYMNNENWKEAIRVSKIRLSNESLQGSELKTSLELMAEAHRNIGDIDSSIIIWKKALQMNNGDFNCWDDLILGELYFENGQWNECKDQMKLVLTGFHENKCPFDSTICERYISMCQDSLAMRY
jgi:tetratricopeptide (TPR) repeat protein